MRITLTFVKSPATIADLPSFTFESIIPVIKHAQISTLAYPLTMTLLLQTCLNLPYPVPYNRYPSRKPHHARHTGIMYQAIRDSFPIIYI